MDKLSTWFTKHSGKILAGMIGVYVLLVSVICIWKYQHFGYSGLDLAIFNNALWNTVHGDWWWSTIQGHNYLGDHFEPILILLLPIYYLWQSPITLLIFQTLVLGLAAWPIYLIFSKLEACPERSGTEPREPVSKPGYINHNLYGSRRDPSTPPPLARGGVGRDRFCTTALGLALLWLINPLVHNINLYEFHAIAFLPVLFLFLFYFYLKLKNDPTNKKMFLYFCVFVFLCLLVREDVAFIVLVFLIITGVDAFRNKNKSLLRVTLYTLLAIIVYALLSFQIISYFSPSGFSPFGYYYGWLKNFDLVIILKHIFTLPNLEMVLGFLAPFFFLPVIKPKWLLISVIPLAQIIFSAAGGGAQVWQIHYGALFLPALVVAFIFNFPKADNYVIKKIQSPGLLLGIIIIFNLALWPSFGPFFTKTETNGSEALALADKIEPEASIMASYNFLPNLSSRKEIYSLHYYFLGVQQFAQAKYILDEQPQYILLDKNDYLYYDEILKTSAWAGRYYSQGYERLEELFSSYQKIEEKGTVSLWQKI